jgi:phosphate transport system protein
MTRPQFHEELRQLELEILEMGEFAERAVSASVRALADRDGAEARRIIAEDDIIDGRYLDVEKRTLGLLALQTPVATDLRLLSAILHINLHLERVGDMAVNIAKTDLSVHDLPASPTILTHLTEMGDLLGPLLRTAMDAFRNRDLDLCLQLPVMDDPIDRLNLGIYQEVARLVDDPQMLQWGLRMVVVARQLERVGDHAVDIGEQIGFLLTGEFREFTDASHPDA